MRAYLTRRNLLFFLLLGAAFLLFFRLGLFPFLDYDEATFALVLSESLQSGDFLSLTSHGQLWIDKPPLLFWLMAISVKLFGQNEFAMRLPTAIFGLAAILGTGLISWQLTKNYWKAFWAGVILLTIGDFIFAARQIRMDVPVAAAILFAVYFFIRGWEKERWYLGFGIALVAGVLLKSVTGLLAVPIILIFSAVYDKWDWLKSRYFWISMALAVFLALPWHIYEIKKFGVGFIRQYFTHNITSRFVRSTADFYYYPKLLFKFAQPWITVFLIMVWMRKDRLAVASLFSAILIFSIFETASTKLFYYLEPTYPFMAIFISSVSVDWFGNIKSLGKKKLFIIGYVLLFLGGLISVFWQIWEIGGGQNAEYALAQEERNIGAYLGSQDFSDKIFTSNFYNYETIYYYGRGNNFNLTPFRGDLNEAPFFLIIPTNIIRIYDLDSKLQERAGLVYAGKILTMFKIQ